MTPSYLHAKRTMPHPSPVRKAFTLIELLVVIAIIAILAAILFPVFAQAKDAAKKTACISNLKNIALGWTMYVDDYDGVIPGWAARTVSPGVAAYWWGSFNSTSNPRSYDWTKGYLEPYLKSGPIKDCGAAKNLPALYEDTNIGTYPAYGMSSALGIGTMSFGVVELPAETILLTEIAGFESPQKPVVRFPYYTPNYNSIFVHGRHTGDSAATAWLDGHVKAMKISYQPWDYNSDLTANVMRTNHLGQILKFPRQKAGAADYGKMPCGSFRIDVDFYYY